MRPTLLHWGWVTSKLAHFSTCVSKTFVRFTPNCASRLLATPRQSCTTCVTTFNPVRGRQHTNADHSGKAAAFQHWFLAQTLPWASTGSEGSWRGRSWKLELRATGCQRGTPCSWSQSTKIIYLCLKRCIGQPFTVTSRAFSRRFYPKQLAMSTFVRRKRNSLALSVQ